MTGFGQPASPLRPSKFRQLADLGRLLLGAWDKQWAGIEREPHTAGQGTLCHDGCVPCCYARPFCSLSEAAAIIDHIVTRSPADVQEDLRLRIESVASSLRRLRDQSAETQTHRAIIRLDENHRDAEEGEVARAGEGALAVGYFRLNRYPFYDGTCAVWIAGAWRTERSSAFVSSA